MVGLVVAVLLAHRRGGGDAAGEQRVQLVDDRRDRLGGNAHRWLRQWRDRHEWYARRSGMSRANGSHLEIVAKPAHPVHALVQDRDDTDVSVAQALPVDVVPLVSENNSR